MIAAAAVESFPDAIAPGTDPGRSAEFSSPRPRRGGYRRKRSPQIIYAAFRAGEPQGGSLRIGAPRGAPWGSGSHGIAQKAPLTGVGDRVSYERRNPSNTDRISRPGRPSVGVPFAGVPRLRRTALRGGAIQWPT